jgi:hypothetical protein
LLKVPSEVGDYEEGFDVGLVNGSDIAFRLRAERRFVGIGIAGTDGI